MKLSQLVKIVRSGNVSSFKKSHDIEGLVAFCLVFFPTTPIDVWEKEFAQWVDLSMFISMYYRLSAMRLSKRENWKLNSIYQKLVQESPASRNSSLPSMAYACNICGRVVSAKDRGRHLVDDHKLSGLGIDQHFLRLDFPYKCHMNKYAYNRRRGILYPRTEWYTEMDMEPEYEEEIIEPKPLKIIYTPMGNRR